MKEPEDEIKKQIFNQQIKVFKMDCQKHFTKLQKMKNTQSKIKPIKIRKEPGTT